MDNGFPGVVIDPAAETCIDEVEVARVPLKACECFEECDPLAPPTNMIELGKKLDRRSLPLVAMPSNQTSKIAYWGQSPETIRDADEVLVPAKFRDDPVVGEEGNLGFDDEGVPIVGPNEDLARETLAHYGDLAFKDAPHGGCRRIWCDLVYLDQVVCLGVDPETRTYQFYNAECACFIEGASQEISDLVTDGCLPRIIPDDQFGGLPSGYPEALSFEYCALPKLDSEAEVENEFFKFKRETPLCARPDVGYLVKVTIESKQIPLTVDWVDTLPAGHTLLSGLSSATHVFSGIGEVRVFDYVVKTPLAGPPGVITGTAEKFGEPLTQIALDSEQITLDELCRGLEFIRFGSQNPSAAGQVFWAGGGRPDPVIPASQKLWIKMYAGQGSPGLSAREQYLTAPTSVPLGAASHVFTVGPGGTTGFAVGMPVWVFNQCFVDNPVRRIHLLDIEAEEAKANPDEEITGLYGTVTAIDPILNLLTVTFYEVPNQIVDFTIPAKSEIMVSPRDAKGFYWEASAELVDLLTVPTGDDPNHAVLRWGYRFWNSTQNPCPGTPGAGYVCDADGESRRYTLHGDVMKEILNPADWIDLWASPMIDIPLDVNAALLDGSIHVCDICSFEPCDIIQIVDDACSGKEGNGPGFTTSVVDTTEDTPGECTTFNAAKGSIEIEPDIPAAIVGCAGFDGFTTARKARVFKRPDICRLTFAPTQECNDDGTPVDPEAVCVNFETGKLTFHPSVVVKNPKVCYRVLQSTIQIPLLPGIYFLRSVDRSGCKSPPSKPIKVVGSSVGGGGPPLPFLAVTDTTSGSFGFGVGAHVPVPGMAVGFSLVVGQDVVVELNAAQDNFSELAISVDAGPPIGLSGMAFHTFAGGVGSFVTMVNGSITIPGLAAGPHTVALLARGATLIPGSVGIGCTVWATPELPLELRVKL